MFSMLLWLLILSHASRARAPETSYETRLGRARRRLSICQPPLFFNHRFYSRPFICISKFIRQPVCCLLPLPR